MSTVPFYLFERVGDRLAFGGITSILLLLLGLALMSTASSPAFRADESDIEPNGSDFE